MDGASDREKQYKWIEKSARETQKDGWINRIETLSIQIGTDRNNVIQYMTGEGDIS